MQNLRGAMLVALILGVCAGTVALAQTSPG